MLDDQKIVITEELELCHKISDLIDFMLGDSYSKLDSVNQGLLMVQLVAMKNYSDALRRRIELFN